jgi:hypothetical protein
VIAPALQPKADVSALIDWSTRGSLAVMFPRTRSAAYDAAASAARNAALYTEQQVGKSLFHLAGFGRTREQASLALLVVRHMRSIRGFQAFGRGAEMLDRFQIEKVLVCYVQACGCTDPRAHCHVVIEGLPSAIHVRAPAYGATMAEIFPQLDRQHPPPAVAGGAATFPCRYLYDRGGRAHPGHPSTHADQIQAAAVRSGCDWCPNFTTGSIT